MNELYYGDNLDILGRLGANQHQGAILCRTYQSRPPLKVPLP